MFTAIVLLCLNTNPDDCIVIHSSGFFASIAQCNEQINIDVKNNLFTIPTQANQSLQYSDHICFNWKAEKV